MPSLPTESIKSGVIGAGAFVLAEFLVVLADKLLSVGIQGKLSQTPIAFRVEFLLPIAIGIITGFLFGITYRYIIRDERNSHLNDGAVLAFGLVRGLAIIEPASILSELWLSGIVIAENIIYFAIARYLLDLAIARKLIKPFV